jgi:hypothetical protein
MYDYLMDYIDDKQVFKAVMFARKMIREGTPPGAANKTAARYMAFNLMKSPDM